MAKLVCARVTRFIWSRVTMPWGSGVGWAGLNPGKVANWRRLLKINHPLIQTGAINCSTIYAYTGIKTITSINFASDCFSGLGVIYWGHINILRQSPHAVWTKCTLSLTLWSWDWSGLWAWDWLTAFCSPVPAFACCMSATRRGREPRLWSPRSITCEFTEPMQPTLWTEPS